MRSKTFKITKLEIHCPHCGKLLVNDSKRREYFCTDWKCNFKYSYESIRYSRKEAKG